MRPKRITLTPQTDDNGISVSQTPAGAGNLSITGVLASGGVATLNHGHLLTVTCAGNDAGRTFTVTGTDYRGAAISEAISGADIAATVGALYFKTVTQIAVDAATAGAIIVGVDGKSVSNWYLLDRNVKPFNVGFGCDVTGTLTYSVQHTFEDLQVADISAVNVFTHGDVAAETTDQDGNYAYPCTAMRVIITAFTSGTLTLRAIQAG
jgi:hypothetical protein